MTDITPDFNVCLKKHGSLEVERKPYNLQQIDAFLQEAHSINARITDLYRELRTIRPAYLSTAAQPLRRRRLDPSTSSSSTSDRNPTRPLTNQERNEIDAQSKLLLRQLHSAIESLAQAEQVRNQTASSIALSRRARGGLGAIGRWAAGGAITAKSIEEEREEAAAKSLEAHREAVILFLRNSLKTASGVQNEMMEVRLGREVEKAKSVLAKSAGGGGGGGGGIPYSRDNEEEMRAVIDQSEGRTGNSVGRGGGAGGAAAAAAPAAAGVELTPEQAQVFAEENHELLKHYEDQLDQVRTAERSILEISELHTTLHANLQHQSEHIDQLVQDSYLTTENLGKGNKELKKASERKSTAQAVFYSTVAFCLFLITWDLVI